MSSQQSQPQRDLVFCHSCENEWYRDEHGLECPECHSDIVEIIEADHDPRQEMYDDQEQEGFHLHTSGGNLFGTDTAGRNEGDAGRANVRVIQTPLGPMLQRSFNSTTTFQSPGGEGMQNNPNAAVQDLFSRLFQSVRDMNPGEAMRYGSQQNTEPRQQQEQMPGSPPPVPYDSRPDVQSQQQGSGGNLPNVQSRTFQFGPIRGSFTTSTRTYENGRLTESTRTSAGGDQLGGDPDIMGIVNSLLRPMAQNTGQRGQHVVFGMNVPGTDNAAMASPLHTMLASLGMITGGDPGNARSGDYVFTQEAFDRLMSQFMAQDQQSTAPGPANEEAIDSLPRIKVSKEMTGQERDTVECGICLTDCELGEEVAELPCKHWFHFECVKHWLQSHDSCPTCRRGITPRDGEENRARATGETPRNWQMPSLSRSNTHESMEGQQRTGGGEAARANTEPPSSGPGLSPQTSRTHRWSRSRSPQSRSRTERSGLGASVTEGFRNGIVGWMGRHFSASSQSSGGNAHTPSGSSESSTRRMTPSSSSNEASTRQTPNTGSYQTSNLRHADHHDLDNPEVD